MTIFQRIIAALWLLFIVYWAMSAVGAKRNLGWTAWRQQGLLFCVVILVVAAVRISAIADALHAAQTYLKSSHLLGAIGAMLVLVGIGLAIFARLHLGRNWGMPMSRKAAPELITSGPYALVRHPIYTGIILAMLGSAMGESVYWALPLVLFTPYFIYSARREEELMREHFPAQYEDYMRRTKMILPFVL